MQLVFSFNPSAFEVWQFLGHIEDLEVQKYKTILVNTYLVGQKLIIMGGTGINSSPGS